MRRTWPKGAMMLGLGFSQFNIGSEWVHSSGKKALV